MRPSPVSRLYEYLRLNRRGGDGTRRARNGMCRLTLALCLIIIFSVGGETEHFDVDSAYLQNRTRQSMLDYRR